MTEQAGPDRWREVDAVFTAALELPPEARLAHVTRVCGGDASLLAEVVSLLEACAEAGRFLDEPAGLRYGIADEGPADEEADAEGERLGAYRVVEQIGRGGWGTVYRAERDAGDFEQTVAVKVLRRGLDTEDVLARFRAEGQILASLSHPHIARLLDGGATQDGRPYLVMELVEGRPITEYCETRRLTIEERIALFLTVADAVQYAHRNLIVHRDLKPSNILVTEEGEVKLLDFGIAKLLDEAAQDGGSPRTRTGVRLMTPAYASPEQLRGEPVTTGTDVYALGMLLYELLAGRPPYPRSGLSPADIERLVCTQEPEPPSSSVRRGAPGTDAAPRVITGDAARRARRLRGDLDTIVLMALRKEPERRYPSVAALAEDLRRHREGLPVAARPDRLGYRAGKFVRRRPGIMAAGTAAILVVAGYGAMVTAHAERLEVERNLARAEALRADEERNRAQTERDRAAAEHGRARSASERAELEAVRALAAQLLAEDAQHQAERDRDHAALEAAKAAQVTEFLVGLFEASDPANARGENLTARDLLERGVAQVERLGSEPEVQTELLAVLGRVNQSLGRYDEALSLAERALGQRRTLYGEQHGSVAQSLNDLAVVLRAKGNLPRAEQHHREALALRRRLLGAEHLDVAHSLNNLAFLLRQKGDLDGAGQHFREALAIRRKLLGAVHPDVAGSLNNLGIVLEARGDLDGAEQHYREALALQRRLLGVEHPQVATSVNNLANVLSKKGDLAGAEQYHRETLALRRRLLGDTHPSVAQSLNNLGIVLRQKGDLDGAERHYREALALRREVLGEAHPSVAQSLNNLAIVLSQKGDLAGAEEHFGKALALRRRLLGETHPSVAQSLYNLGVVLRQKGDFAGAEDRLGEALTMRRALLGATHPDVAQSLEGMGLLSRDRHEYDTAAAYLREALDLRLRALGEGHPDLAATREFLQDVLGRMQPAGTSGS